MEMGRRVYDTDGVFIEIGGSRVVTRERGTYLRQQGRQIEMSVKRVRSLVYVISLPYGTYYTEEIRSPSLQTSTFWDFVHVFPEQLQRFLSRPS